MAKLFLDKGFKPTFEKVALESKLSDNPDKWQQEIANEVYKNLPYIADYAVNIVIDRADAERGYAFGSVDVTNVTDAPQDPQSPAPTVRIPIIVKDRVMSALDVMMDPEGNAMPLNERRLRETLFRTETFEMSGRKPTDQGMVDQLYPPMRTNYGYGNAVSTGAGMGKMASSKTLLQAIAPTITEKQANAFVDYITKDQELLMMTKLNPAFQKLAFIVASTPKISAEKTASARVDSIKPTVVQLTKLASGKFKVKWANINAFAPQEDVVPGPQANELAGADLSGMQPGQTLTLSTEKAQKESLDEPDAKPIEEFGYYKVKNSDTQEELDGWVIPVIDLEMHPLPMYVFISSDGQQYACQDEIVGIRLPDDAAHSMPQMTPIPSAEPPMPEMGQQPEIPSMPKMAGLPSYLKNMTKVRGGITNVNKWPTDKRLVHRLEQYQAGKLNQGIAKNHPKGSLAEKGPKGSMDAKWRQSREELKKTSGMMPPPIPAAAKMLGKRPPAIPAHKGLPTSHAVMSKKMLETPQKMPDWIHATGKIASALRKLAALNEAPGTGQNQDGMMNQQGAPPAEASMPQSDASTQQPMAPQMPQAMPELPTSNMIQGDGIFLFVGQEGNTLCTIPLTIMNSAQGMEGTFEYHAQTVFGEEVSLMPTPESLAIMPTGPDSYSIPDTMEWISLSGEPIHLYKTEDDLGSQEEAEEAPTSVDVKSTGPDEVSLEGPPVEKVAREQRWFLKSAQAEFLLVGMGYDPLKVKTKLAEARRLGKIKIAGLKTITPLSHVHAQSIKTAASVLENFPIQLRKNLIKEAAALEDSETADSILSMNFINPENISTFANYLPVLDDSAKKLAEMLIGARMGMKTIPEGAAEKALKNLEEVIAGLKALQQKSMV